MARIRDWDQYFLRMATETASMGTCDRLQVGCVIVKDRVPIGSGFNGSIKGDDHCDDVGHLLNEEGRCIRTLHDEENAILQTEVRSTLKGATAYCTHEPCENCTKRLRQVGIARVVFAYAYSNKWNKYFIGLMKWEHIPLKPMESEKGAD